MRQPQRLPDFQHLRREARRRVPGFVHDFVDGGSGPEVGKARNRAALDNIAIAPRYVVPRDPVDMAVEVFGRKYDRPFGVAPMGLTGLIWPRGELAFARAARAANMPVGLSTACTVEMEEFAREAGGNGWFQLYPPKDEEVNDDLLRRAADAGFAAAFVTVDVPARGWRPRDMRNGLTLPPRITPRSVAASALRPRWSMATLAAGVPRFETMGRYAKGRRGAMAVAEFTGGQLGQSVTTDRLKRIRDKWKGDLVIKGVMHPADAEAAISMGYNGILVSNHGARQLDAAPSPIEALPDIVRAVGGRAAVTIDSGFESGLDVVKAYALGAEFVFCGRVFMWSLAALGHRGAQHAVDMLTEEVRLALTQIGCPKLSELDESWLARTGNAPLGAPAPALV